MTWNEFHDKYKVEATISGSTELRFAFNTAIYGSGRTSISEVLDTTIIDRKTLEPIKSYRFKKGEVDVRDSQNILKAFLVRDFHINEMDISKKGYEVIEEIPEGYPARKPKRNAMKIG